MSFRFLLELDARLSDQLRVAEKPGILRRIAVIFAHSGDSWFWAAALITFWFFSNSVWKQWEFVEFPAWLAWPSSCSPSNSWFAGEGPRANGEGFIATPTRTRFRPDMLRVLLIATIASALGPSWLGLLLWIWAPLVALARVAMGVHYLSDVLVGAVLGVLVALIGLQIHQPLLTRLITLIGYPLW